MLAIIKKELKSYFLSPIGWIYIGMFLTFCSLFFFTDIFRYKSSAFSDLFGITVSVLSVLIPILTMRTFAEERNNKCKGNSSRKIHRSINSSNNFSLINICVLLYINVFWKTRVHYNTKCFNWVHIIIISVHFNWIILLKFNRKSNYCSSYISRGINSIWNIAKNHNSIKRLFTIGCIF